MTDVNRVASQHKQSGQSCFVVDSLYKVYGQLNVVYDFSANLISSCITEKVDRCGIAGKIIGMKDNSGL